VAQRKETVTLFLLLGGGKVEFKGKMPLFEFYKRECVLNEG